MELTYANLSQRVKEAAVSLLPTYLSIRKHLDSTDTPVWFNADNIKLAYHTESHVTADKLQQLDLPVGQRDTRLPEGNWIFVKKSDVLASDVFGKIPKLMNLAPNSFNQQLGQFGTSPLFSMLTSGLLGGGLGYMGGAMAEQLLPERYLERGKLRKTLGTLGALAGAAGPAYLGTVGHRNWDDPNRSAWNSWIEPNVFFGQQKKAIDKGLAHIQAIAQNSEGILKEAFGDDPITGEGMISVMPHIPVDAFNRSIMADPFASLPIQTAAVGLVEAANQAKGNSGLISPFDIARIGVGMGAGLSQAYIGGKVLGALAGLTPQAQQTLQQAGMYAGALKAVVPGLFGR